MERYTVNIKQIDWLSKEIPEAEVMFEINEKHFWAFCHPCNLSKGETTEVCLSFIEEEVSEAAFWDQNNEHDKEIIASESNRCSYYCYGQLKSIHPVMVNCGAITFSFGDWINDERAIGSYVYFVISRLDIGKL